MERSVKIVDSFLEVPMISRALYPFILTLLFFFFLPKILLEKLLKGKRYPPLKCRFGFYGDRLTRGEKPLVWVHAVSVGETKAVAPLIKQLKEKSDIDFIVTNGTVTGHEEAKKSLPGGRYYLYLPLDFKWIVKRLMKQLKPEWILVVETDFWMNFLSIGKEMGAKIFLVNGKLSKKTCKRYLNWPFFTSMIFPQFDRLFLQNSLYRERFLSLGVPSEKLVVTGNLKLDCQTPRIREEEKKSLRKRFQFEEEDLVIAAGSTHRGEEELILKCFMESATKIKQVKLFLVPRHPERFEEVEALLQRNRIDFVKYSCTSTSPIKADVVLVDAMGVLKSLYQISDLAIVGGSFVNHIGGHNILEPCEFGVPVLFGPHMYSQPEMVEQIECFSAGIQVDESCLTRTIDELIGSAEMRKQLGEGGIRLIHENRGATEKTHRFFINNEIPACGKS